MAPGKGSGTCHWWELFKLLEKASDNWEAKKEHNWLIPIYFSYTPPSANRYCEDYLGIDCARNVHAIGSEFFLFLHPFDLLFCPYA